MPMSQAPAAAGFKYGNNYVSNTNLAANTPGTVFTPGQNANGAWVWKVTAFHNDAGALQHALIAKSGAAPTSVIDGVVISIGTTGIFGTTASVIVLDQPVFIPAGFGLYFISTTAESSCLKSVLYTLL